MAGAKITRRLVLNAGLLTVFGIAVSGCGRQDELQLAVSDEEPFGVFSTTQAKILSDVADIMIPQTETVGAAQTKTVHFLDQLMQTWAGEATKTEFQSFIESLDAYAQANHQNSYLSLPADVRQAMLEEIDTASFSETPDASSVKAYRRVKWLIFHIHYTSEAANPDFVLVPGQYRGDISETEYYALVEENRW